MKLSRRLDLGSGPLSTTVLNARRHRLETRWREGAVVSVVLAVGFGFALWGSLYAESMDAAAFGSVGAVVLALLLICALQALVLNFVERIGLLPATASQLELVDASRGMPLVARYVSAVAAHNRGLNRKEAGAIIVYAQRQPRGACPAQGAEHADH